MVKILMDCFRRSLIFWSDTMLDTIHQADQNGENDIVLVNTNIQAVGMFNLEAVTIM